MSREFKRPTYVNEHQNSFQKTETGVTHPYRDSYIKFADNGDSIYMVNENTGIILSHSRGTITIIGDAIKFVTREKDGLQWNNLAFNPQAHKANEPTFVFPSKEKVSLYDDIDEYFGED